jgi:AraC-like DNA-binding protein
MNIPIIRWGRKGQPHHYRNHLRNYSQCMLILLCKGSLLAEWSDAHKNNNTIDLGVGSLLLLPPHAEFTLSTPDSGYSGHFMEIDPVLSPWNPYFATTQTDTAVNKSIADIEREIIDHDDLSALPTLYQLLFCRCTQLLQRAHPRQQTLVEQVHALLMLNCNTEAHLQDILSSLPYSARHLRRLYQGASGQTIKQAFTNIKLSEAKRLLLQTDMSITAIAFELGYPSSQYFSGMFKQHLSQTPGAFRKLHKQKNPGIVRVH